MPPVDRDALTSGGFLILVDLTRPLQITMKESPPLTPAEVGQIRAFIQGIVKEMEPGERRKKFELWINPAPPQPGASAPASPLRIEVVRSPKPPRPPGPDFRKVFPRPPKPEDTSPK